MQSGTKIAFKTLFIVMALGIVLLTAAVLLDENMNRAFQSQIDDWLQARVNDHPLVKELEAERDSLKAEAQQLRNQRTALSDKLDELSSDLEQATQEVNNTRSELGTEFERLKSELAREVSSREIAIDQVRETYAVIRVGDKVLFDRDLRNCTEPKPGF